MGNIKRSCYLIGEWRRRPIVIERRGVKKNLVN